MAIARGFAATAMFAGLAVGAAGSAWADTPTMNGSYTETATTPSGGTLTEVGPSIPAVTDAST